MLTDHQGPAGHRSSERKAELLETRCNSSAAAPFVSGGCQGWAAWVSSDWSRLLPPPGFRHPVCRVRCCRVAPRTDPAGPRRLQTTMPDMWRAPGLCRCWSQCSLTTSVRHGVTVSVPCHPALAPSTLGWRCLLCGAVLVAAGLQATLTLMGCPPGKRGRRVPITLGTRKGGSQEEVSASPRQPCLAVPQPPWVCVLPQCGQCS